MAGGKKGFKTARAVVDPNNKTIINQIMLKFRPIAPRPVTVECSGGLLLLKEKRSKRKYVRMKKKITERCNSTINDNDNSNNNNKWIILNKSNGSEFVVTDPVRKVPELISFDVSENNIVGGLIRSAPPLVGVHEVDPTMTETRGHLVESWITMESVTGACEDLSLLRCTDEEIWKDLEINSCPGFISNGYDEVQWVNLAYRRMVGLNPEGEAPPSEVLVWLAVKLEEQSMVEYLSAFSCRVRVVYQLLEKKKQMTVPCDVWKMDSGSYAWRFDVIAALSLGRLN